MQTSETIGELAKALAAAQAAMSPAVKRAKNPHFRSNYASLEDVIEAASVIHDHGIAFVQAPAIDIEAGLVTVTTRLVHTSGEWIECAASARPVGRGNNVDLSPQPVGSAITYLKRYGLQSLLGIPSADDDGNAASHRRSSSPPAMPPKPAPKPKPKPKAKPAPKGADAHHPTWSDDSPRFCARLRELTGRSYEDVAAWCESVGKPRPSVMSDDRRARLLGFLEVESQRAKLDEFCDARDFAAGGA